MATKQVNLVITINGEELPKTKCRKIRNKYYKIGKVAIKGSGDCFRVTDINGVTKYKTLEKGQVVWDEKQRKYVHKSTLNSYLFQFKKILVAKCIGVYGFLAASLVVVSQSHSSSYRNFL